MDESNRSQVSGWSLRDRLIVAGIFLGAFLVFYFSPVTYYGDSRFALLVSQAVVSKGTFELDDYHLPIEVKDPAVTKAWHGMVYQVKVFNGHDFYEFPPGGSILSIPFVVVGGWLGESVLNPDGTYNPVGEEHLQRFMAPFLMAVMAVIFFCTARLLLPVGWSAVVALGGAFGTQVWSTASRALWSQTWCLVLLGVLVHLLLLQETGRRKLNPIFLGTLLSWLYFVRPTSSVVVVGVTIYVLIFQRSLFPALALTGAAWLAGFLAYSWHYFGSVLPWYFQPSRVEGSAFFREALMANLISPSRGFFIAVPVALFVLYLLAAHWRSCRHRRLVWLALTSCLGHWVVVSGMHPWTAGWCFGPRFLTEWVPWFVLLACIGLEARLRDGRDGAAMRRPFAWRATWACGALLACASIWMNGRGALSWATVMWNGEPQEVDHVPERIWNWSYPQFLAGYLPVPPACPVLDAHRQTFGEEIGTEYMEKGWSPGGDITFCWTDGLEAQVQFSVPDSSAAVLRMAFRPYLHPPERKMQRVIILLNGKQLTSIEDDRPELREFSFPIEQGVLQPKNELTFQVPDAVSPKSMHEGGDYRRLGIALHWIELDPPDR